MFVAALLLGVIKAVSLPIAALLGAFGVFISKCITPEDAYREVDWRAIILIACMLSLGAAMEATGPRNIWRVWWLIRWATPGRSGCSVVSSLSRSC